MKKVLRRTLIALGIILFAVFAYFRWMPYDKIHPLQLIPSDAIYILESDKPIEHWKTFSESEFWTFLKKYPALADLTEDADYLDSLINANKTILSSFGDRHFVLSAHMTKANDYDFLFAFDLKRSSRLDLGITLSTFLNEDDFSSKTTTYKGQEIIEVTDKEDGEILYLSKLKNYLICSYASTIVHDAVDLYQTKDLIEDEDFNEVYAKIDRDGLGQFYLNYHYLDQFLGVYLKDEYHLLSDITSQFSYTGVNIELETKDIRMTGFTSIPFERKDYAHLIQHNGSNRPTYQNVLSSRCAYVQSMHISNATRFYNELLELRQMEGDDVAAFKKLKLRIEKSLKLSLEDDFLSWFGDEIFVAQNMPDHTIAKEEDIIFGIKLRDKEKAFEKLENIQKQIKRRTPATFKQFNYKGYDIHYLDLKSLFNLFFGRKFKKLDKPYYTVIDDFILFSNDPKTLVALLEDYENKEILAYNPYFNEVKDAMPKKMSLFTYVNGPLYYRTIDRELKAGEGDGLRENKAYFNFFNCVGIAYTANNHGFKNAIYLKYDKNIQNIKRSPILPLDSLYNSYMVDLLSSQNGMSIEVKKGDYVLYYPDGKTKKIVASIKDAKLHGKFEEFYPDGKTKAKGRYRSGRKIGIWTYYNVDGKVEERKWGD